MATRRPKTLHFWNGHLPHWQVENGRYFVTIQLRGAVPQVARERMESLIEKSMKTIREIDNDEADRHLLLSRAIFREMERWLDRAPSVTHFRNTDLCEMMIESIEHRQQRGVWEMFSFAIMRSHIHLFFDFNNQKSLKNELEEFKRWTGHQATRINTQWDGKRFWQSEWFDHWSRSDEEDVKIIRYIRNNPVKAGLAGHVGIYPFCK